jgi:peptidoglycan/LPS O-acetylase OafA/YrhL
MILGANNGSAIADRTSSGKDHFEVLDGLRGTAAFLIMIFHASSYSLG